MDNKDSVFHSYEFYNLCDACFLVMQGLANLKN